MKKNILFIMAFLFLINLNSAKPQYNIDQPTQIAYYNISGGSGNGTMNETYLCHLNQTNDFTGLGDLRFTSTNGATTFDVNDGLYSIGYLNDSASGHLGLGDWGVSYYNGRFYIVGDYNYYLNFTNLTDSRDYAFPDKDGMIALISDVPTSNNTNFCMLNRSNNFNGNELINISNFLVGTNGVFWEIGANNEIRNEDDTIVIGGDTYKCYFNSIYGAVRCGDNPYAFSAEGTSKFGNVTIMEKIYNSSGAVFTLQELNSTSSGVYNLTYQNKADYNFTNNNFNGSGNFWTTGNISANNFRSYLFTRTLPVTVGGYVEILNASTAYTGAYGNGAGSWLISITVDSVGFTTTNSYLIPMTYGIVDWRKIKPTMNSEDGIVTTEGYDLYVNYTSLDSYQFRLGRTVGSTAGTAVIYAQYFGTPNIQITEKSGTGTMTLPSTTYKGSRTSLLDQHIIKRNIPTVINNTIMIGNFTSPYSGSISAGNGVIYMTLTDGSTAGLSHSKAYIIPWSDSSVGTAWKIVAPITSTGSFSSRDYEVNIKTVGGTVTLLRIKRIDTSTAGGAAPITINIMNMARSAIVTFAEDTATSSDNTTLAYYGSTIFEQKNGEAIVYGNLNATNIISGNSLITRGNTICNATVCFYLDKLNASARTGVCPNGKFVNETTTSGVICDTPPTGGSSTWADLAGVYDTYSYDGAITYNYWDGSHVQYSVDTKLKWTGDTLNINGNILLPSSELPTFSGTTTDSYNDGVDSQIDFSSGLAIAISTAYDESLMKDITYINNVVDNTKVLVPIKFKWNEQGIKQFGDNKTKDNYQIGYKASDVEKFYPDCIVNTNLKQMTGKIQVKTATLVKTYNKDCLYAYIYAGGLK